MTRYFKCTFGTELDTPASSNDKSVFRLLYYFPPRFTSQSKLFSAARCCSSTNSKRLYGILIEHIGASGGGGEGGGEGGGFQLNFVNGAMSSLILMVASCGILSRMDRRMDGWIDRVQGVVRSGGEVPWHRFI